MCNCQADVRRAFARANTRKDSKRVVRCQVRDCCVSLSELGKPYCLRKRVCPAHLTAEVVLLDAVHHGDKEFRFCHQCGKLEALAEFEGTKRSCRTRLLRRRISQQKYRNKLKKRASSDRDSTYTESHSSCHNEDSNASSKRRRHMFPKTDIQKQPNPITSTAATTSDVIALNELGSTPPIASNGVTAAAATAGQQQQQQVLAWDAVSPSGLVQPGPLLNLESFGFTYSDAAVAAAVAAHHSSSTPAALARQASIAQPKQQQQQQQGLLGSCYPPAEPAPGKGSVVEPLWDEMLQAFIDYSNSVTDENNDIELLHQIEHELATEQQQQQAASAVHDQGFITMSTRSQAMPATSSCSRQLFPGTSLGPNWQQILGAQQQQQQQQQVRQLGGSDLLQHPNQAAAASGCQPIQLSAALSMQCSPASVGNSMVMTGGFPSPLNVPLAPAAAAAAAAMPATMDINEPPANIRDLAQLQQTVNDLATTLAQLKSDVEASVGHMMVNPSRPRPMMNTHALGMLLRQAAELLQQQQEMQETQHVMPAALGAQPAPVLQQVPQEVCGAAAAAAVMWQQYMQL